MKIFRHWILEITIPYILIIVLLYLQDKMMTLLFEGGTLREFVAPGCGPCKSCCHCTNQNPRFEMNPTSITPSGMRDLCDKTDDIASGAQCQSESECLSYMGDSAGVGCLMYAPEYPEYHDTYCFGLVVPGSCVWADTRMGFYYDSYSDVVRYHNGPSTIG